MNQMILTRISIDQTAERLLLEPPAPAMATSSEQPVLVRNFQFHGCPEDVLPRRSSRVFEEFVACRGNGLWSACENLIKTMDLTAPVSCPPTKVAPCGIFVHRSEKLRACSYF